MSVSPVHLSSLYRYPLKSAIGERLEASEVDALGLEGDRRWMAVDARNGRFFTQRALPVMTQLSAHVTAGDGLLLEAPGHGALQVTLPDADSALREVQIWRDILQVPDAGEQAAQWLSDFLQKPSRLVQVPAHRVRSVADEQGLEIGQVAFADGFPLLLVGQASLDDLSARVGRPMEMLRFRPNLVVDGSAAYAEDGWRRVRIGEVSFRVVSPCTRCILTTNDPATGQRTGDREPLTTLQTYRARGKEVLFGQNLIAEGAGRLQLGMPVTVLE